MQELEEEFLPLEKVTYEPDEPFPSSRDDDHMSHHATEYFLSLFFLSTFSLLMIQFIDK